MLEVNEEQEQRVISRKLQNKDAKCHVGLLRIDEDDSKQSLCICKRLQQTFKLTKK